MTDWFITLIFAFLFLVYAYSLLWNIGIEIDINILMPVAIGLLIFYSSVLIEHAKPNWFIGIRTPWTLSSDEVWEKTHKLGGRLSKVAGLISAFGVLFKDFAFFIVIIPVTLVSIYSIPYSFFEYQKQASKNP
ncbi:MAG: SdpI family protein [Actinomycetota bacterium]|nr:SdpI family protein [Actinomycetota bacterium]